LTDRPASKAFRTADRASAVILLQAITISTTLLHLKRILKERICAIEIIEYWRTSLANSSGCKKIAIRS
uniref:IS5/IS1182 family transposase n=1 Tax=Brugia timori TaxID=42155 RepID=A0A0R3RBY8_9BILA